MNALGELIRERRVARGLSQREVAEMVGIHPAYLSQIENGSRKWPAKYIEKISDVIEVPVSDLMEISRRPAPGLMTVSEGDIERIARRIADEVVSRIGTEAGRAA